MIKKLWSNIEVEFLKKHYGEFSCRKIAGILHCGSNAVRHKAKKMGLCKMRRHTDDTLCWRCKKAMGDCLWSQCFLPIEGWTAEKTWIQNDGQESYFVKKCPEFKADHS